MIMSRIFKVSVPTFTGVIKLTDKKKLRSVANGTINGVRQISLSHVIIELIVDEGTSVTKAEWIGPFRTVGGGGGVWGLCPGSRARIVL